MTDNTQCDVNSTGYCETHGREYHKCQSGAQELDVNKLEQIIADHNKEMRTDMASEITGGTRSKAITDVITVKAILDWHNKQVKNAVVTAEDNLDQYWNKELDKQIEEVLDRLYEEQRIWMHEHSELKLGHATYMLSLIQAERAKLKEAKQ